MSELTNRVRPHAFALAECILESESPAVAMLLTLVLQGKGALAKYCTQLDHSPGNVKHSNG